MSTTSIDTWRKPPAIANPVLRYGLMLAIPAYVVWALDTLPFDCARVSDGLGRAGRIFGGPFPPSFERPGLMMEGFLESPQIAVIATAAGVLLSAPIWLGRFILVASRSVNIIMWALLFVAIFGPGVLAGILAITFRSLVFLGKLMGEAIEEIDRRPVEALEATGASKGKVILYAIVPQLLPAFWAVSILRWDINIRESTVLGLVGAGGRSSEGDVRATLISLSYPPKRKVSRCCARCWIPASIQCKR